MFFVNYRIFLVSIMLIAVAMTTEAEPPIELIYWKSSDVQLPTQADIDSLIAMMTTVQSFFASEMDRYGYGQKTFSFNKDITVVSGKKKLAEYANAWAIQNEYPVIDQGFSNAIYVVFLGGATQFGIRGVEGGGVAVSQPLCAIHVPEELKLCNNLIVIPADAKHIREVLTAHEIGHAFSLFDHAPDRLIKNKVDVMFFPLFVTPGVTEYLKNYALNPEHAKFLNEDNRLFIQDNPQGINEDMNINVPYLVAYYPFEKNTEDVSQNSNDGKTVGKTQYVEGKFGDAISFDNGAFVQINTSDSLDGDFFTDTFTIVLWVYSEKQTGYGHVWKSISNKGGSDTLFVIEDTGTISWRGRIDGKWSWGELCETDPSVFKSENWVHVAITNDGNKLKIYVDGNKSAETDFQETDGRNTNYRIGSSHTNFENFVGLIDDYAIFSKALTKDEINDVMVDGLAMFLQNGQLTPMQDSYPPEDINHDGVVDLEDVKIVRSGMQNSTPYDTDVNDDGITDKDDLALVKLKAVEAILAAAPRNPHSIKIQWTSWGSIKNIK